VIRLSIDKREVCPVVNTFASLFDVRFPRDLCGSKELARRTRRPFRPAPRKKTASRM
jgi:hypothetical protein